MKQQKEKLYLDFRKLSDLKRKGVLNLPIEVIESINVCLKYGVVSPKDLKLDGDCKHSKRRYIGRGMLRCESCGKEFEQRGMLNEVKTTERGWAGHFISSHQCLFRRNTLIEYKDTKIVVSTVGNLMPDNRIMTIGYNRYYETMAFHADEDDKRYFDADVSRQVYFDSDWSINHPDAGHKANQMHDTVVNEIIEKLKNNKI